MLGTKTDKKNFKLIELIAQLRDHIDVERIIGLNVDDQRRGLRLVRLRRRGLRCTEPSDGFSDAAGAVGMIGSRHHRLATEAMHRIDDPLVIGSDDDTVYEAGLAHAVIDVLDQRPPGAIRQHLAGEPNRGITSGDDGDRAGHWPHLYALEDGPLRFPISSATSLRHSRMLR